MIMRLALAVVVAATGTGVPTLSPASPASPPASPTTVQTSTGAPGAPTPAAAQAAADDTTVTHLDVVVPAVDASGRVQGTPSRQGMLTAGDDVVADDVAQGRVSTDVVDAGDFQTLGVTWPAEADGADLGLEVRTRAEDGSWSAWVPLAAADDAPDEGTADALHGVRAGTPSLWVGDADAVQLSFAATPEGGPADLRLTLVDVPAIEPAADATVDESAVEQTAGTAGTAATVTTALLSTDAQAATTVSTAVPMAGPVPRIISRAEWGARPQVCTPDVASRGLVGAVLHHTAGPNTYSTVSQAMQQIQGDQRYHIEGRQWCDIGYNFIVDKWGNIYEGRAGSLTQAVIGVHAGGFNTGTVGVSMLGTYDAVPPPAVQTAVGQIIGFRLAAYNVDPQGSMIYRTGAGENSKFRNQDVALPRVFGHRDVGYTACPGNGGYAAIPNIRAIARPYYDAQMYAQSQSVVKALYQDLLGRGPDPTGLTGWTSALMSGVSQAALVESLTRSDEYINLRVRKAYDEVLGRAPDPEGARGWLVAIRNRQATVDDVQRRFYDSTEYFTIAGGTQEGYVQRLYTTMLRRGASQAEVADWVARMDVHGRAWVVDQIWFSMEAARVRAGDYYRTFLGRGPDPTGQTAWAQVLLVQGEGAVRNGIAGSTEYRLRAVARFP